jgi:hypothetical protein
MPEDRATRDQRNAVARLLGDNRDNSDNAAITLMELQKLQPVYVLTCYTVVAVAQRLFLYFRSLPKPLFKVVLNHINKDLVEYYNEHIHG